MFAGDSLRVGRVTDVADFPADCHAIRNRHVAEFSDLRAAEGCSACVSSPQSRVSSGAAGGR